MTSSPVLPEASPRPLGDSYQKNGFDYELVMRDGKFAIFAQRARRHDGSVGGVLAYEVIVIRVKKESEAFGKIVPCREVAPADEDFGMYGWSYPTKEMALPKYRKLIAGAVSEAL